MSSSPTTQAQPSAAEKRRKRLASYTFRNMVYSVLAVAALAMIWWSLTYNPQEQQTRAAEVGPAVSYAAEQSDFQIWLPEPGEGWRPTVARFDTQLQDIPTWHLSFETPEGQYVALYQAADVTEEWTEEVLAEGEPVGEATLGGPAGQQVWQAYEGPRPSNAEEAWVLGPQATGGSTVVVAATAALSDAELQHFLDSVELHD